MQSTHDASPPSTARIKRRMRKRAIAARAAIASDPPEDAPSRIRCQLSEAVLPVGGAAIAGFWPMGSEIGCTPILEALYARGFDCCLPVVVGRGKPLAFRRWNPAMELVEGSYGEKTPPPDAEAVTPDILLVPGLLYDRRGYRLGYGAGYYDRTLAALRAERPVTAVGIAYAAQLVREVPADAGDEPVDRIVTEEEMILCRSPQAAETEPAPHAAEEALAPPGDLDYSSSYATG